MSKKDVWKVMAMLSFAVAVVALLCYARVDLGMSQEQINQQVQQWVGKTSTFAMLIWSQIIVAAVALVGYKTWRRRADNARCA